MSLWLLFLCLQLPVQQNIQVSANYVFIILHIKLATNLVILHNHSSYDIYVKSIFVNHFVTDVTVFINGVTTFVNAVTICVTCVTFHLVTTVTVTALTKYHIIQQYLGNLCFFQNLLQQFNTFGMLLKFTNIFVISRVFKVRLTLW